MTTDNLNLEVNCEQIEFIEEHFHPSGSVQYQILKNCSVSGCRKAGLFELTQKYELRQV